MDKYIDLHSHSQYSGGDHDCPALLSLAKSNGISVFSLTDHNAISGIEEMLSLAKKLHMKFIPGVEIYTFFQNKHLHILGYNFNLENNPLTRKLKKLNVDNKNNLIGAARGLEKAGFKINVDAILNSPAHNYGVLHVLKELENYPENMKKMEKELPPEKRDFFDKVGFFCGKGKPGYLPLSEMHAPEAIKAIRESGGFACLAHPGQQLFYEHDKMVKELVKAGLRGIEILSPYHSWHHVEHYQNFCLEHNLLMTGGSDYHSDIDFSKKEMVHRQWDYFRVPYRIYEQLKKHIPNL